MDGGFTGTLLPVNPKYAIIHGQACFESVSALKTSVDLATIATAFHSVADIVSECVEKKIGGAVIISAGGKKVGEPGRELVAQASINFADDEDFLTLTEKAGCNIAAEILGMESSPLCARMRKLNIRKP